MGRLGVLCAFLAVAGSALAQEHGDLVTITQSPQDDLYAAGRRVEIRAPIEGDAVLAGQEVVIEAPVRQDVIAAGDMVTLTAPVGDDVRAAGREVRIDADVAGHLVAAGAHVELTRGKRVGSFAWLAGEEITVAGEVAGDLKAAGQSVRIAGRVRGNADIRAERLELLPGARIDGALAWHGGEPRIDQGAVVVGPVTGEPAPIGDEGKRWALWARLISFAALATAGIVLLLLFPRAAEGAAARVREQPLLDAGVGFAALFLTPVVIILLFMTGIGWLLALILLAAYLAALPVGWLIGTYALARMALGRFGKEPLRLLWRTTALLVAVVLAAVLQMLPFVGWLLGLLLLVWGLGAILPQPQWAASRSLH